MRTIKWLKEQIANLPDDAEIVIDKEEIWVHTKSSIHLIAAWEAAADLSEASLESLIVDIRKHCADRGERISIMPTHWKLPDR